MNVKKYLLEINHPGQVYLFQHIYFKLIENGHTVIVTTKSNPAIEYLLQKRRIPYTLIGKKKENIAGKLIAQLQHNYNAYKIYRKYRFDYGIGTSVTNDHLSFISKMKAIHFSDDDQQALPFINKFSYPFSDAIVSPSPLIYSKFKEKVVSYEGTHELAYLHPNHFKPDPSILDKINISANQTFYVMRFVAMKAYHDAGHRGLSFEQKKELIDYLSTKGSVFITSERPVEKEFEKYRIPIPPEDIHSLLYYANMFIGDSQTMTSEAAILGTPALKCNTFAGILSVPNELENKYGLCFSYHPDNFNAFFDHVKFLSAQPLLKESWREKRMRFLNEKIDVTAFIVWFLENYPDSKEIMMSKPEFQYKFK